MLASCLSQQLNALLWHKLTASVTSQDAIIIWRLKLWSKKNDNKGVSGGWPFPKANKVLEVLKCQSLMRYASVDGNLRLWTDSIVPSIQTDVDKDAEQEWYPKWNIQILINWLERMILEMFCFVINKLKFFLTGNAPLFDCHFDRV